MKKILFKQIWNERRSNVFLWMELFVVFVILWYIVDAVYVTARVYTSPLGFDIKNTYVLRMGTLTPKAATFQPERKSEENMTDLVEIVERLSHRPDVEAVSISQNCIPYNEGSNGFSFNMDTVRVNCLQRWITPGYFQVFRYQNVDGSGSQSLSDALTSNTLVVSVNVADGFPNAPYKGAALRGRYVNGLRGNGVMSDSLELRIAALSNPVRYDEFSPASGWGGSYVANYLSMEALKSLEEVSYIEVCLRVREGQEEGFTDRLMEDADRLYQVGNVYILSVTPLSSVREVCMKDNVNELKSQFSIMFFLLLNIFLGIIGTFWFRTQHRRSEVALLMALGSTRSDVCLRLISEGMLLLSIAAIPAMLVALNLGIAEVVEVGRMPFEGGRFLVGILITFLLMAAMIIVGIWYPARQAMKIQPAEALHEE